MHLPKVALKRVMTYTAPQYSENKEVDLEAQTASLNVDHPHIIWPTPTYSSVANL